MDASVFVDASKVSRSEARALIKDIEAAQDPFEKFAAEQDRLTRALNAGAIDQALTTGSWKPSDQRQPVRRLR